ncbi:MAG: 16S rRNA (uracil(1498)-N(3))-methyltransferase [Leptolyngbyaceae cyanobacterium SM2_5_2]|nr:16S rRNA (uracil(1498)-N(3))-methyltransferase [Leptolyngbyaceae cyanobacterium SM2_5_2]
MQRLIVNPKQLKADQIWLTVDQQHYLYRVLRLGVGDRFLALDGQGHQWVAALTATVGVATVTGADEQPAVTRLTGTTPTVTLAVALPKGSGFDDIVRQATELGVTVLQPLITERTLQRPSANKLERWRRIAAEATEQSERRLMPAVKAPVGWSQYLQQANSGQRWLCVARRTAPHLLTLAQQNSTQEMLIATGPEGGWADAEINAAVEAGFQLASLGSHILRAVTAPLAALAIVMAVADQDR